VARTVLTPEGAGEQRAADLEQPVEVVVGVERRHPAGRNLRIRRIGRGRVDLAVAVRVDLQRRKRGEHAPCGCAVVAIDIGGEQRRVVVPAVYETVTREVVVGGGELSWAEVLCETNTTRFKVAEIQGALTDAGYPTLVDGAFGPRTLRAMEAFQRANGLAVGYMTVETANALGIDPYGDPPQSVYAALGVTESATA